METVNYSIIIPVFNEEENLKLLYSQLMTVLKGLGKSYEIIFIDDGIRETYGKYK